MRIHRAALVVAVLASLILTLAGPAQAKRMLGTKGSDRLVGTAEADVIKARGGNDRVKGGRGRDRLSGGPGRDRLFGGRGADRLNAVDGLRDRLVRGGPGKDVCRVDPTDRANTKGCETVKIANGRGPGARGPGSGGPGAPGPGAGGPGGRLICATPPEDAKLAGGGRPRVAQEDLPPTFSDPFYAITISINASVDGLTGDELPISIEEVCDVPEGLASEAAQLIGGDGVALTGAATTVFDAGGQQLTGDAATTALAGADSVSLKAQLARPAAWRQDEDGQPVPTFATSRADITD
jgi:Ca2+-binding RTX toxin-like protein